MLVTSNSRERSKPYNCFSPLRVEFNAETKSLCVNERPRALSDFEDTFRALQGRPTHKLENLKSDVLHVAVSQTCIGRLSPVLKSRWCLIKSRKTIVVHRTIRDRSRIRRHQRIIHAASRSFSLTNSGRI